MKILRQKMKVKFSEAMKRTVLIANDWYPYLKKIQQQKSADNFIGISLEEIEKAYIIYFF